MTWKPRALIFDMDGLLVDSEDTWEMAENTLLAARNRRYGPGERHQLLGLRTDEFLEQLIKHFRLEDSLSDLRRELIADMLKLVPQHTRPQPGAPEILTYAAQRRLPRAIASAAPPEIIEAIVASQGWQEMLPLRISADSVPNGKPAPDVYLEAARQLGIPPADCLALEDSPNGARSAVAAGMVCYAVPDPAHTDQRAFHGITRNVFGSLHEVLAWLQAAGV